MGFVMSLRVSALRVGITIARRNIVKTQFRWVPFEGRYTRGEHLMLGKIRFGGAGYNGTRPKIDPNSHRATVELPGLKVRTFDAPTIDEVKASAEGALEAWLNAAGLAPIETRSDETVKPAQSAG